MISQLLLFNETLGATRAFVRFDHVMLGYVYLQMFPSVEFLRAYVAEVFLPLVNLNVTQQSFPRGVLFVTFRAFQTDDIGSSLPADLLTRLFLLRSRFYVS